MKGKNTYLIPIVLLLCAVCSRVLLAEHRDTRQDIMSEISRDRDKYKKRDRRMDVWTKDAIHQRHFKENSIANTSSTTWTTEAVDAPKVFSDFYSRAIAVDNSGLPHIAYGGDHLYYAYHDGSIWNYETVDSSPEVGDYASIALGTSGKERISYFDWTNRYLKYATNASGAWVTTTVDSSGYVGEYTSIAIDSNDKAHVSYYDLENHNIKYATNATDAWVTTTIVNEDRLKYSDGYSSIAIDSKDKVHIGYSGYSSGDFKYADNA